MGKKDDKTKLIQTAKAIADLGYPVFPTDNKSPIWSNDELGLEENEGGFKIATVDYAEIEKLFSHKSAFEISVPTGDLSGLLCLDVDTYKDPTLLDWITRNEWLHNTLCHKSTRGGYHFFFNYDAEKHRKLGRTLRSGVDIKGHGGYVCWEGSPGYSMANAAPVADLPDEVLEQYKKIRDATKDFDAEVSFNDASDDELIAGVLDASVFHDALLTMSWRMTHIQKKPDNTHYTAEEQLAILNSFMNRSVAADPNHPRHKDWKVRMKNMPQLIAGAFGKESALVLSDDDAAKLGEAGGDTYFDGMAQRLLDDVGAQQEVISQPQAPTVSAGEVAELSLSSLYAETIPPVKWVIPNMLPYQSVVSLAGASNVGKTRWLAALAAGIVAGDTEKLGLPAMDTAESVMWVANEEHVNDIKRRVKAAVMQYEWEEADTGKRIYVIGKDKGRIELVISNDARSRTMPLPHEENIKMLIEVIREKNVKVLFLDPYITLSTGGNENDSAVAAIMNAAFNRITSATGCVVFFTHHCPKESNKEADWYAGSQAAWRGSGAIYSSLDCGFTLSPYVAKMSKAQKDKEKRGARFAEEQWVVLDSAKIREGKRLTPIFYELASQEMRDGEGADIGVCRLSNEDEARSNCDSADVNRREELVDIMIDTLGSGFHKSFLDIHKQCRGKEGWVSNSEKEFPTGAKKTLLGHLGHLSISTSIGNLQIKYDDNDKPTGVLIKKFEKDENNT